MRDDGAELRTLSEADKRLKGETVPVESFLFARSKRQSVFILVNDGETKQRVLRRLFLGDAGTNVGLSTSRLIRHKREEQVDMANSPRLQDVRTSGTEKISVKAAPHDWERLSMKMGNLTSSSKKKV